MDTGSTRGTNVGLAQVWQDKQNPKKKKHLLNFSRVFQRSCGWRSSQNPTDLSTLDTGGHLGQLGQPSPHPKPSFWGTITAPGGRRNQEISDWIPFTVNKQKNFFLGWISEDSCSIPPFPAGHSPRKYSIFQPLVLPKERRSHSKASHRSRGQTQSHKWYLRVPARCLPELVTPSRAGFKSVATASELVATTFELVATTSL